MNCKSILSMSILFLLLPAWIGILWVEILKIRGAWNRILHAWITGFVTMLGTAQLVLVPLVALQQTLTMALMIWKILLTILALVSFGILLEHWARRTKKEPHGTGAVSGNPAKWRSTRGKRQTDRWQIVFGVLAAALILLQAYIPARYEHRDDDDSRFVAEEVSALVHDTMYQDSPITSDYLYWNEGEVRKDLTSPWAMYVAMCCRICDLPAAVLSHSYLPFFLILLCYGVYLLIGKSLMRGDREKTFLFLIVLSVIHLWGYTSTHTLSSMLLLRIWQGKAMCASFMLPLLFYVMYQVMQRKYEKGWIGFLYVAGTASCLLSGIGIVTAPVIVFLYGIVDFVCYRRWRKTFAIWMSALPCAIFLGYYLIG